MKRNKFQKKLKLLLFMIVVFVITESSAIALVKEMI